MDVTSQTGALIGGRHLVDEIKMSARTSVRDKFVVNGLTTAKRVVDKINDMLGPGVAQAIDGGSIRVTAPLDPSQRAPALCGNAGQESAASARHHRH